jgi:Fic family protein
VKKSSYVDERFGRIEEDRVGSWPHGYFMPAPIPRGLQLSGGTQKAVDEGAFALGELSGIQARGADAHLVLVPTIVNEALSSSRIEGTIASLSDVLSQTHPSSVIEDDNVREVSNYLQALRTGASLLESLPITQRLFCDVHRVLLTGVRGGEKDPGNLRHSPVWVGPPGVGPEQARFIPPLPAAFPELLSDWERYVNLSDPEPVVVKLALAHYQFETIHPFLDGNGRVGRVIIILQMMAQGVLTQPSFGISSYLERYRSEYYERLQAVRERGELDEWVGFFARGLISEAQTYRHRILTLTRLRASYRNHAGTNRASMLGFIDSLFRQPIITVRHVQDAVGLSQPASAALIRKAEGWGWLTPLPRRGRGGMQRWFAHEIWTATTDEQPT